MNLVIIGAQWGDEGKGKIVDFLACDAGVVVRFSGGPNAGHPLLHDDHTYNLHLVPSGVLYPDTTVVLGTGMVIDPEALFAELDTLSEQGLQWEGRVMISDRAHLVLPAYRSEDVQRDKERRFPIGTTGRGIGIAYSLKSARDGLRLADILDDEVYSQVEPEAREFFDQYRERLAGIACDITELMHLNRHEHVLLEGAQGALLDLDLGTYPYVSSGYSAAAGAALGAGVGPRSIDRILGVFKAYSTRVGNGPFPTELDSERDAAAERMVRELGREYGVTTGRKRRIGYLDLVALRYVCRANSIDGLVLTHIDVYDEFDEIKVCVAYDYPHESTVQFPASRTALERAKPVTRTFKGWKTSLADARSFEELPSEAKAYIEFIEGFVETPVDMLSVGYERERTIVRRDPWNAS